MSGPVYRKVGRGGVKVDRGREERECFVCGQRPGVELEVSMVIWSGGAGGRERCWLSICEGCWLETKKAMVLSILTRGRRA